MNKWLKTILFLLGSALLTRLLPFSSWFRILDTMVHELGHAVTTLLLSGSVLRIELNPDHSGATYSIISSNWSSILVSLSGYTAASLFSILMFYGYYKRRQKEGLILITTMALLTIIFFVRSGYGLWWLLAFAVINIVFYLLGPRVRNFYYLVLAFLCLEESVIGPISLAIIAITRPGQAGDAANLANSTFLPAILWALLFVLFALWCAKIALQIFWRKRPAAPRPPENQ